MIGNFLRSLKSECLEWHRSFLAAIPGEIGCKVRNGLYGYQARTRMPRAAWRDDLFSRAVEARPQRRHQPAFAVQRRRRHRDRGRHADRSRDAPLVRQPSIRGCRASRYACRVTMRRKSSSGGIAGSRRARSCCRECTSAHGSVVAAGAVVNRTCEPGIDTRWRAREGDRNAGERGSIWSASGRLKADRG